jgi:hypothetical protein
MKLAPMNAARSVAPSAQLRTKSVPSVGLLRALLWAEAIGGLVLAIFLSLAAKAVGADGDTAAEEPIRFAAGGAILLAILALVASRGARKRRPWAWTLAAMLQVVAAVATGVAVLVVEWHPAFLIGFALAAVVMLVLSTTAVRRALGQA